MIAIFIGLSGMSLLYFGRSHILSLNRESGIISKEQKALCFKKKKTNWAISQVKNIRVFRRGHDGLQFRNIHYEVQFDFADVPNKVMLKTLNLEKARSMHKNIFLQIFSIRGENIACNMYCEVS